MDFLSHRKLRILSLSLGLSLLSLCFSLCCRYYGALVEGLLKDGRLEGVVKRVSAWLTKILAIEFFFLIVMTKFAPIQLYHARALICIPCIPDWLLNKHYFF